MLIYDSALHAFLDRPLLGAGPDPSAWRLLLRVDDMVLNRVATILTP